jgi:hypothetical protein
MSLLNLPNEILEMIINFLPINDYNTLLKINKFKLLYVSKVKQDYIDILNDLYPIKNKYFNLAIILNSLKNKSNIRIELSKNDAFVSIFTYKKFNLNNFLHFADFQKTPLLQTYLFSSGQLENSNTDFVKNNCYENLITDVYFNNKYKYKLNNNTF